MKIAQNLKSLTLLGLTALTLAAPASQAESGYIIFGNPPQANPWLNGPAYQQARFQAMLKERLARLDQRQDGQMRFILDGMEEGRLTSREAVRLLREHVAIANLERKYLADGRMGPNELDDLERRVVEAGRRIEQELRDRERRGPPDIRPDGRPDDRPGEWGRR